MAPRRGRRVRPRNTSFSVDVRKFAESTETDLTQALRLATLRIFQDIVFATPVDTGRARGSWTIGNDRLPTSFRERKDKGGNLTVSQGTKRIEKAKGGESIFIASNLVYMPFLEYGSSFQSPRGMVRVAARRFRRYMREVVRQIRRG